MNNCAFTIVAKNYVGLAQILEKSIRQYYNDLSFYIIVADEVDDILRIELPANVLIAKEVLDITSELWNDMSFKYNLTEFCTSIKPASFRYLLNDTEYENIIYLDPDIYFYNSIGQIFDMLDNCNILLTPHITQITETAQSDAPENVWLSCGIFNLGFCGISRSEAANKMLTWWHNRLINNCYIDNYDALFTDQKWMDFMPSFFTPQELHVSHHLGMNVAPWNFFERKIVNDNDAVNVTLRNGIGESYPLLFVHYSGYNYTELKQGRVVQNNISDLQNYVDIIHLTSTYADAIRKQSSLFDRFISQPYTYNIFNNGCLIEIVHRRLYRSLCNHGREIKEPFSVLKGSFYCLLFAKCLITKTNVNIDKVTKNGLNGVVRKLCFFNHMSRFFYKLLGYERYMLLMRLMRPFSRYESQIHLLDAEYDSTNIF